MRRNTLGGIRTVEIEIYLSNTKLDKSVINNKIWRPLKEIVK